MQYLIGNLTVNLPLTLKKRKIGPHDIWHEVESLDNINYSMGGLLLYYLNNNFKIYINFKKYNLFYVMLVQIQ